MFISSTEIIPYYRVCKKLVVKVSNLEHNHRIGSDLMGHYPSSRKLNDETALAVKEVLSLRPNTKHVKEMIEKKYGKFVTLKDIHNYKTRMKNEVHGKSKDAQLLLETLEATL